MDDSVFVRQYDQLISSYLRCFRVSRNKDLKQDVYLKIFSNRRRIDHSRNVKAYIYSTVKSVVFDYYRQGGHKPEATKPEPVRIFLYDDYTEKINRLPKTESLKLHIQGYKYREIAEKLGCSLTAVRSRIFRARRKLRKLI